MGYMNLGASMRYGPSGKRRKTNAWTTKKRQPTFESRPVKPDQATLNRIKASEEHRKKYPSLTSSKGYTPSEDTSYRQEVSKQYTVAIGYNKGAYQVIPKGEIKDIGK
tara:strand:+ start:203 stop:526 length:324 start_codon:yes stop_codon:yes gene_type:complete